MLTELTIENLGVIERTQILLGPGFTAVTGETGAGKTMLVEAINLVIGRRADATVVREGASEARVEARFVMVPSEDSEPELVLSRVVSVEGRSRAYVNGRMATVASLAEVGSRLVEVHGQNEHQHLLSMGAQRAAIDAFAGVDLAPLLTARRELADVEAELSALGGDERARAREIDLLRFQCEEIEGARLRGPSEDEDLSQEEDLLAGVERQRDSLLELLAVLSPDGGAIEPLGRALKVGGQVPPLRDVVERLSAIHAELTELARDVRHRADSLEEDPARLTEIRLRRQLLKDLTKKYGSTVQEVMEFGAVARRRLTELEGHAETIALLESRRSEAVAAVHKESLIVGAARRACAAELSEAVEARLHELGLPHARLTVSVGEPDSDPGGESVVFLFAANPGSSALPLSKVASGGELSRVMLALRLVLVGEPTVMVFDEVDAGIGGEAAVAVAKALRELGGRHQVFAVTHLAQMAASAHSQIRVSKEVVDGRTFGVAESLGPPNREEEIARMLSGGVADEAALVHARDLVRALGGDPAGAD